MADIIDLTDRLPKCEVMSSYLMEYIAASEKREFLTAPAGKYRLISSHDWGYSIVEDSESMIRVLSLARSHNKVNKGSKQSVYDDQGRKVPLYPTLIERP